MTVQTADFGYTIERCRSGLGASTALAAGSPNGSYWESRERWWKVQLAFAEAAQRHAPEDEDA